MEKITHSTTPWIIPLSSRIEEFHSAKGKKRILFLYNKPDSSTFRYRGYNIYQYFKNSQEWSLHFFFCDKDLNTVQQLLPKCDLLVLCRTNWTYKLDVLISKAKFHGIKVIYDVDDLIFDLNYIPLLLNTLGSPTDTFQKQEQSLQYWFSEIARNYLIASRADGFIVTNSFLGQHITNTFNKPYVVLRNSLNREQLDVSKEYARAKACTPKNSLFTIGYFSGSPTHMNDFSTIAPEITMFLSAHSNTRLLIVGYMRVPTYMQPFVDNGQIQFHPLVDFLELQRLIASVDVNIVPLIENDFTNCKSELKYFEAAIVDTITIATPTYAYRNAITHGKNGFLCRPGQWFGTLEDIYYNRVDLVSIAQSAREHAVATFSGSAVLEEAERCYNFFTNHD